VKFDIDEIDINVVRYFYVKSAQDEQ